ncbi:tetratricopeptide (TPR) repeat protein [Psychromicrobium silvestre]|uniref:Tetratricopeptide (TPR) repeat protein n=1 Tax=Psychromicrobium silvestre TaxID=1645614 RepID=A0A7Y9LRU5_9MICC|nr:tetratricopeptide repeat protein [Psychromicrobium silvestre]NYE94420.1 tetratricopeptide (TPR) repeat protein [Psychromicrobium silvestre]
MAALERKLGEVWADIDVLERQDFVAAIDAVTEELAADDPLRLFERGAARDSTGYPDLAVPLYQAALEHGLSGERRRRAVIQMASSIRNLGQPEKAVELLTEELKNPHDHLEGAVKTFLALALADLGREREGLSVAIEALSGYLPRYNRSTERYAQALLEESE